MITTKVHGLTELHAALQKLKYQLRRTAVKKALRSAADVIRTEARARAPVLGLANARRKAPYRKPGTVRKAIGIVNKNPLHMPAGAVGVSVKVRAAKPGQIGARSKNDPFYAVFLEFGTKFMTARPFMGPAARKLGQALEVFKTKLGAEIERFNGGK